MMQRSMSCMFGGDLRASVPSSPIISSEEDIVVSFWVPPCCEDIKQLFMNVPMLSDLSSSK